MKCDITNQDCIGEISLDDNKKVTGPFLLTEVVLANGDTTIDKEKGKNYYKWFSEDDVPYRRYQTYSQCALEFCYLLDLILAIPEHRPLI